MRRIALCLVIATGVAHADDARAIYEQAAKLYAEKQYLAAASRFEASYAIDPDPAMLFNIAQAYRLGHACAQAARFYHQFLAKVANPPDRAKLETYVTEMDACAKAEAAATAPTVIHDTQVVHDAPIIVRPPAEHHAPVLAIAIGGAGVVALGLGAYFTYDVHQLQSLREGVCPAACVWSTVATRAQELDDRGRRAQLGEQVFYVAGAAAVIASAVLFLRAGDAPGDHVVTAAPLPGGGASVAASWRF